MHGRPRLILGWLAVAALYVAVAETSEAFSTLPEGVTPVWPPSGIVLALAFIFGTRRVWPGVFLGAFIGVVVDLRPDDHLVSLVAALAIASGATLEMVMGVLAQDKLGGGRDPFVRVRSAAVFVVVAVFAPAIPATFGTGALMLSDLAEDVSAFSIWITWAVGDSVGIIVFTPLILAWRTLPERKSLLRWLGEWLAVASFVVGVIAIVSNDVPVGYLILLPVMWASFRLGRQGASLLVVLIGALIVWTDINGLGSFARADLNESLLLVQAAVGTIALLPIAMIATLTERRHAFEKGARLQADLETARAIQRHLLPAKPPTTPGYDIAGWSRPADQTGGDFYDWIELEGDRVLVVLGDVSGHGIGPALVTAACRAYVRSETPATGDLGALLSRVNELLCADLPDGRFITFFAAVAEPNGKVRMLSAGHGPICVLRGGQVSVSNADGPPLAVVPGMDFGPDNEVQLGPNDSVVVVTDGFTEWPDRSGDMFGNRRLTEELGRCNGAASAEIIERLERAVAAHVDGTDQADDLTAIVIKRTG